MTELLNRHGRLGVAGGGRVGVDMAPSRIYRRSNIEQKVQIQAIERKRVKPAQWLRKFWLGWAGLSDVRETARATILTGLGGGFADPAWRFLSPAFFNDMPL